MTKKEKISAAAKFLAELGSGTITNQALYQTLTAFRLERGLRITGRKGAKSVRSVLQRRCEIGKMQELVIDQLHDELAQAWPRLLEGHINWGELYDSILADEVEASHDAQS